MQKSLTEIVFILDRSGSMGGLEDDTIGGYNSVLKKQQAMEGEATITTVLFDDKYELLHDRINLKAVSPITQKEYFVRGTTALLDAIGRTIAKIDAALSHTAEEYRAEKVLFVITTDGMENASREFSYDRVRDLVEKQKQKGWEFLFLGANIDAVETAGKFGIDADRAANFHADKEGLEKNFMGVNDAVSGFRACCAVPASWKEEIEKDYTGRKGKRD